MTKSNKSKNAVTDSAKQKTSINWAGIPAVVFLVANIITTYVFVTQDNKVLIGVGAVHGLYTAWTLGAKFVVR